METFRLVIPNASHAEEIIRYRHDMLKAGSSMDGCSMLEDFENPLEWLAWLDRLAGEQPAGSKYVSATEMVYIRESDGRIVGMIDIRHTLNDYLRAYGGNIGYSVHPDERRKGYASAMLRKALPYCREKLGLKKVMISCLTTNEASRRTILSNGGLYDSTVHEPAENEDIERYYITL